MMTSTGKQREAGFQLVDFFLADTALAESASAADQVGVGEIVAAPEIEGNRFAVVGVHGFFLNGGIYQETLLEMARFPAAGRGQQAFSNRV